MGQRINVQSSVKIWHFLLILPTLQLPHVLKWAGLSDLYKRFIITSHHGKQCIPFHELSIFINVYSGFVLSHISGSLYQFTSAVSSHSILDCLGETWDAINIFLIRFCFKMRTVRNCIHSIIKRNVLKHWRNLHVIVKHQCKLILMTRLWMY